MHLPGLLSALAACRSDHKSPHQSPHVGMRSHHMHVYLLIYRNERNDDVRCIHRRNKNEAQHE